MHALFQALESAVLQLIPVEDKFRLDTDMLDIGFGAVLYDKAEYNYNVKVVIPIIFISK